MPQCIFLEQKRFLTLAFLHINLEGLHLLHNVLLFVLKKTLCVLALSVLDLKRDMGQKWSRKRPKFREFPHLVLKKPQELLGMVCRGLRKMSE